MYSQWFRVILENCVLVSDNKIFLGLKQENNKMVKILEATLTKKDEELKEVRTELDRTQKSLRMMN